MQPAPHRQNDHRRHAPPPLLRVVRRRAHPPLAPLSLDLLRVAAPQQDPAQWRACVLDVCAGYPAQAIAVRVRELAQNGYLTAHGTPRTGWLTPKGQVKLAQYSTS